MSKSKKTTEIIVASYKEQLNWIKILEAALPYIEILPNLKFKIYRTGHHLDGSTHLENRGLEANQWLSHIVLNYDNLADYNFFVQADLGLSARYDANCWPKDLNVIKSFKLPDETPQELGPIDDFSFYTWPYMQRIRCAINEKGMSEEHVKGIPPELTKKYTEDNVKLFWKEKTPEMITWPSSGNFMAAQHLVTKNFIHRLPKEHYEGALDVVKKYEMAHWLEHGKWPTIVYDIYRQGPLANK